jgi:Ca-activated chloride channel family protein
MRFANPHALTLLLAVPAAVLAYGLAFASRRRRLARLGDAALVAKMAATVSVARKVIRAALVILSLALLAVALARPQAGGRARVAKQRGLDLVVALDFSRSMLAKDVYPSRLERAKRELEQLLDGLGGDRVGVIAFAGETLGYPATTDYAAVKLFWRDLGPWDMPVGGTAIGRAIHAALDQLVALRSKGTSSRGQAILLLTDGEDTDSEPLEAADEASKLGVKIFTVGIGSRSGELIPEYDEQGKVTGYVKDADGHYVTSRLAEDTLAEIARRTGGELFHADSKRFGVEDVSRALNNLKRTENEARIVRQYDEIFELLLLPAFLLLVGEACMGERRKRVSGAINPGTLGGSPRPPAPRPAGQSPAPPTRHGDATKVRP